MGYSTNSQNQTKSDRARLAGTQLNLIRDTCDYLYRLEEDQEWRDRKAKGIEAAEEDYVDNNEPES